MAWSGAASPLLLLVQIKVHFLLIHRFKALVILVLAGASMLGGTHLLLEVVALTLTTARVFSLHVLLLLLVVEEASAAFSSSPVSLLVRSGSKARHGCRLPSLLLPAILCDLLLLIVLRRVLLTVHGRRGTTSSSLPSMLLHLVHLLLLLVLLLKVGLRRIRIVSKTIVLLLTHHLLIATLHRSEISLAASLRILILHVDRLLLVGASVWWTATLALFLFDCLLLLLLLF